MESSWVAIVGLGLGLIAHLIATVWWASKVTTLLEIVRSNVNTMMSDGKQNVTKEDLAEKLSSRDQQIAAIWKRLDSLIDK